MTAAEDLVEEVYRRSLEALEVVREHAHKTPIEKSSTLSRLAGRTVYLKYENLQKTGAFKVRGALYKLSKVKEEYRGVVAASAGNHAQGVAYAGRIFGLHTIIVMPEGASISKIEATRGYGAEVILAGRVFDETLEVARSIAEERGYALIHAFDDIDIMAGQATVAHEIIEQVQGMGDSLDAVAVPVGGGGLIAGVASVFRKLMPETRIYAVEPEAAPKTLRAFEEGRPVHVEVKPTIADGLVVKRLGENTWRIIRDTVSGVALVSEDEIAHAIYMLLERGKVLAEGAGAVAPAAIMNRKIPGEGPVAGIVSGGNIDLTHIYRIILRGLAREGRLATITGYVPDAPGQLKKILSIIAGHRGNVIGIYHDRTAKSIPAWHALVKITFEAPGQKAIRNILRDIQAAGYEFWLES